MPSIDLISAESYYGRASGAVRGLVFALICAFVLFASGCISPRVVEIPGLTEVEVPDMAAAVGGARVVFAGELHDDSTHHRLQLEVIRALNENGVNVAVGLEMFSSASQEELDGWVAGEISEREFKDIYLKNWHASYRNYRDIFRYARENRIPLVGINIPRSLVRKVFKEGTSALAEEVEGEGLAGIECDVDEKYEELIRDAMGDHRDMEDSYEKFCETQMVWDMAMAIRIVRYLKENPESTMVVITGSAHAWRRGIARQMRKLPSGEEVDFVVIIPELPGKLDRNNIVAEDTDYLILDPWM